jgi:transposase
VTRPRTYPSDTTDAEWGILAAMLPPPACTTPRGGRPEKHDRRDIVDAIRYVIDNGCKWRATPSDFPPWRTVYNFFERWARTGVIAAIRDQLRERVRRKMGRCPNAVTLVIDSQSVKAAETVSKATRGYDTAKAVNGRKRHLAVDTKGLLVDVLVTAADVTDRDAARLLLARLRSAHPEITLVWADSGYSGELEKWAKDQLALTMCISRRPPGARGFVLVPRRWVVERSLSWIMRARRLVRDYERLPHHSEAEISFSAITLMARRLADGRIAPDRYPSSAVLAAAA